MLASLCESQLFYKLTILENIWEKCRGIETGGILLLVFEKFFKTGSLMLNWFQQNWKEKFNKKFRATDKSDENFEVFIVVQALKCYWERCRGVVETLSNICDGALLWINF